MFDLSPQSIQVFTPDGRTLRVNRAWEELWGTTLDQLGDYNVLEDPQLIAKGVMPYLKRGFAGEATAIPAILYDPNETLPGLINHAAPRRWVRGFIYPVKDEQNRVSEVVLMHEDITQREQAEEQLQQQQQEYQSILDSVPALVWYKDKNNRHVRCNSRAAAMMGLPKEKIEGVSAWGLFPHELAERFYAEDLEVINSGEPKLGIIEPLQMPSGEIRWHQTDKLPHYDQEGNITGVIIFSLDITQRQRAEESLRDSERMLAQSQKMAHVGSWESRLEGEEGALQWSDETFRIFGYEPGEVKATNDLFFQAVHPNDRDKVRAAVAAAVRENRLYQLEHRIHRPDGTERIVHEWGKVVVGHDGRSLHLTGTCQDITERRQVEEEKEKLAAQVEDEHQRLGSIIASVPGVVWEAWGDPGAAGQRIDFVSDYVEAMLGYTVQEWLQTPSFWLTIVHPEDRERAARVAAEQFSSGRGGVNEFRWMAKDGRVLWVEAHASVMSDATGRPVGMRGVTMDVSARKQAQEERERLLAREQQLRSEAESANQLKDEFLATLSHELRTPLTAILGWGTMLQRNQLEEDDQRAHAVETIVRNAKAQAQLIEDLLDVSRIITGNLRLDVQPFEIAHAIKAAVDGVRPAANAKGISLQVSLDPHARLILGDPARIQQVAWNLLSNAVKYTPEGGRVQVRTERVNSQVEMTVSDTGEGIPLEFLPHVFDRFRQADQATTRRHGGLGLGLAIVRHLAELHGATVHVDSAGKGKGATFTVKLPLMVSHDQTSRVGQEDGNNRRLTGESSGVIDCEAELDGLHVIVVDDEEDTREMVALMLRRCGADVSTAGSTDEALSLFNAQKPDVLVSDIGMPGEDGYTLIRRVRRLSADKGGRIPALALTAYARTEDSVRALSAGYQVHVAKPVDSTDLIAAVASLAGRSTS